MQHIPIITSSCVVPLDQFWKSVLLYYHKPHTVNRKVAGVVQLYLYRFESEKIKQVKDIFSYAGILYQVRKLDVIDSKSISHDFMTSFIEPYNKGWKPTQVPFESIEDDRTAIFLSVRILLSRVAPYEKSVEIVILNRNNNCVTFLAASKNPKCSVAPQFPYTIELQTSGQLRILLDSIDDCDSNSADWLCEHVFTKLLKWAENQEDSQNGILSLSLVDVDAYYNLYHTLKLKYGNQIMQIWTERTDPKKFVHEDIAIAAYLISLWQKYHTSKPSFLDLGCGNGLLVYILSQEGYQGFGIDVRKRKIWDRYPEDVKLEVKSITPAHMDFPKTDWIVGNHSDELTPWIPLIAFRNSRESNFFLLPCCPFDFNGEKYKRLDTSKSQYSEYMEYVKQISELAGFNTKLDKLRIPSTRRQCIVGTRDLLSAEKYEELDEKLTSFIAVRSEMDSGKSFKPRSSVEKVRNCTQLDKSLISRIIKRIVVLMLEGENYLITDDDRRKWNKGKCLPLRDLPMHLPPEDLQQLKKECGGLKTLLKNHRYIFDVQKDEVSLRPPLQLKESSKYKDKLCWFLRNHPDGCLYSSEICAYKHL